MRRLMVAWMSALLLVAITAAPAGAQSNGPGVYITSPSTGQTLTGTTQIKAHAVPADCGLLGIGTQTIESIRVTINAQGGGSSPEPMTQSGSQFSQSWNTRSLTPRNGIYDITAVATPDRCDPHTATVKNLKVNNPPAAPTGVSAAVQGEQTVVTWKANTEPDITGYKILRASASGSFEQVGSVKTNKFTDAKAPAGHPLRYQVVAVRYSPVTDSGVTAKSSATKPVTIPTAQGAEGGGEGEAPADGIPEGVFVPETTTGEPEPEAEKAPPPAPSAPLAPIIRDEPLARTNIDFDDQLPFDAPLPEQFNSSDSASINAAQSAATDSGGGTVSNPMKFIATGLFLLVFSIFLARTSRRLFKGKPGGDSSKPPTVSYPAFKVGRS